MNSAISDENLKALASKTTDPEVLLGFAFLAPVKSPIRREILEAAVKIQPGYSPIATVLAIAIDGTDEQSIDELIKSDPDNALGYYLQAHQLYEAGNEKESPAVFQKASTFPELRLYGNATASALFKALDALNLQGRDRLKILCEMATRMNNFYISNLQQLRTDLSEMAHKADLAGRKEIADLLLIVGGHLFATNFSNRKFAEWSVEAAFRIKAQIAAAEKSPTMNGYMAVAQALVNRQWVWPDTEEKEDNPLEAAQFLPSRISRGFIMADPSKTKNIHLIEMMAKVPDSDKAAFEGAEKNAREAAAALIEVSLTDPDGIIGAYLKDLPPPQKDGPTPWVSTFTHVEKLIWKRPDIFRAAAANEKAMRTLEQAGNNDPNRRNIHKLMRVGSAISCYMANNDQNPPASLEELYKDGKYLKGPAETQSLLTGKPYVYAAAGAKFPEKLFERFNFILLYDYIEQDACYHYVTGEGGGGEVSADKFEELLRKRGKS